MADVPSRKNSKSDPDKHSERGPSGSTPRWVKAFGLVALIAAMVFGVVHIAGGGLAHHTSHLTGDGVTPRAPQPSITDDARHR